MPVWPTRLLYSNAPAGPGIPSTSSRSPQYLDDSDDDSDDDDAGYFSAIPPPHRYDAVPTFTDGGPSSSNAIPTRGHARSMSDKLPTFLGGPGGGRRRNAHPLSTEPIARSVPSAQDIHLRINSSPQHPKTSPQRDDEPEKSGNCATCDSKVRWPATATEFRCTTCQMINDLRPRVRKEASPQPPTSRAGTYPGSAQSSLPLPLTLERTTAIIDRCIKTYLDSLLSSCDTNQKAPPSTPPDSPTRHTTASPRGGDTPQYSAGLYSSTPPDESAPALAQRLAPRSPHDQPAPSTQNASRNIPRKPVASSLSSLPVRPSRNPPPPPITPVSPPIRSQSGRLRGIISPKEPTSAPEIPAKSIFKPLEDYVVRSFGDRDCLNASFSRFRPRPTRAARSEDDTRSSKPFPPPGPPLDPSHYLSELDAKTLLLGDVAENGLWWAGSEERSKSVGRRAGSGKDTMSRIITPKSPGIIWRDVYRWYAIIIFAGMDWRDKMQQQHREIPSVVTDSESIDSVFLEARSHLVRVLLRTSEHLLKRPGKPLKLAEDVRFLLIVLDNPLLYPSDTATKMLAIGQAKSQDAAHSVKPKHISTAWESGHAFGILKRCFGLLANIPQDAQKYLVSWFARYEEEHFRRLVGLAQIFVTHRLKKQHGRKRSNSVNPVNDLVPSLSGTAADTSAQLHAAIGLNSQGKSAQEPRSVHALYMEDWQIRAAARVMLSLFTANKAFRGERSINSLAADAQMARPGSVSRDHIKNYGQLLSTTEFYNSLVELQDVIADFDLWEAGTTKFTFCQFPFLLSVGAKIRIMDHDARRQMEIKAREAFFKSIMRNKQLDSYLVLKVRRDCLAEDSLKNISEVVGQGQGEIKKGLKVQFVGEEGIDAGGLRKEWFLLLLREIFDPANGMFLYNEESQFCYFNPSTFEPSDQFFLVGALLGLAIYNSVILDVALPPFTFKKLINSGAPSLKPTAQHHGPVRYTIDDLAELKPSLARGLRQLLEFDGDVESTFYQDFTVQIERYGVLEVVPLCPGGESRPVTNTNRQEFVDLYIRYLLDTQVVRQYEPFRRGFFTVCGGNALSLFQSEEIELLLRGSDEPLDVPSLKAVALYENWQAQGKKKSRNTEFAGGVPLIQWFWELFEDADPKLQRRLLGFITGSDRIPAVGATSLIIKVCYGGPESGRYPIARTCFNQILLYDYPTRDDLRRRLWTAVMESEGFGLK